MYKYGAHHKATGGATVPLESSDKTIGGREI